ncbi:hypothetical protein A2454_04865 [Candidatus Peribacteria bacterium RIFOXYC2_FULL_55_14]|nr:MAG: Glutamine amidotransferase of anthranilate synthase or aminodeoxychorismate synthase [Candidatus Peribacteria bacterium GW2011_GWC2_54_8]KKW43206.1 MAG: Glutamine amidotransferase of anthranilate synthase or aminodeoxychorismate synthase [Candidatus Peregrinibacteria bacterium GW2011_GWA2_54_9]OGJ71323.1 MAG: hypothetical protein A2198_05980 [Candidatus Peribacteria bacterium RIFOXYA1_FULL_56_14]OGJ74334.1 MAG: hypothetical protein A2384_06425 [Candidatus Peribacteria bacterium RIFOXYB1_
MVRKVVRLPCREASLFYSALSVAQLSPETTPATEAAPAIGKVLILDNYDSFTYNIRGALAKLGIDAVVVRNNKMSIDEVRALNPSHIIIGPGPGTPDNPEDIGITNEVIEYAIQHNKALLGICLGHQAIVKYFGGAIVQAQEILHGKMSQITSEEESDALFEGVDMEAPVMRYHSLAAEEASFPQEALRITSRTRDSAQTIMSVQHKELPIVGMQFHPESFATPEGQKIMDNFLRMDEASYRELQRRGVEIPEHHERELPLPGPLQERIVSSEQRAFEQVPFPCALRPEQVYERLHAASDHCYCFESLDANGGERVGRFSYFGMEPDFVLSAENEKFFLDDEEVDIGGLSAFDALNATVEQMRAQSVTNGDVPEDQRLTGGFVGGMSYEAIQYREPSIGVSTPPGEKTFSYGYFSDGLVYDNREKRYYYYTRGKNRMAMFQQVLGKEPRKVQTRVRKISDGMPAEEYKRKVRDIRDRRIRKGETFQTVFSRKQTYEIEEGGSMAPLYLRLRERCPSGNMHAIKMGEFESIGSFPELTLKIRGGEATTYQVAGTRRRTGNEEVDQATFEELLTDVKECAEHMMLIDLARNDLEMSSIPGSVTITPEMRMHRLDAGAVMHIASEIRSRVNGIPPLSALLAIAPMGTVSGAPKVRSMQIIHENEDGEPRGLYAGSFGFVDMRGDLEAVVGLRSLMRYGRKLVVQAGAGIVYDSDEEKEYQETVQKMQSALQALEHFLAS